MYFNFKIRILELEGVSSKQTYLGVGLLVLRSIYSTVMMSYGIEKLCGYIVWSLVYGAS